MLQFVLIFQKDFSTLHLTESVSARFSSPPEPSPTLL